MKDTILVTNNIPICDFIGRWHLVGSLFIVNTNILETLDGVIVNTQWNQVTKFWDNHYTILLQDKLLLRLL